MDTDDLIQILERFVTCEDVKILVKSFVYRAAAQLDAYRLDRRRLITRSLVLINNVISYLNHSQRRPVHYMFSRH